MTKSIHQQPETSGSARRHKLPAWLFLATLFFLSACANHAERTGQLLSVDYQHLTNDELRLHFYQLEDQIDIVEHRSSQPRISLGLGLGSYGSRSGVSSGVGVSSSGRSGNVAGDLRDRRNQVRLEMQKRGIAP